MKTTTLPDRLASLLAPATPGKVYSYARFSTPEQAKGDSFRRQSEAAERWAKRHDLALDSSLSILDEGVSAYRGTNALDGGLSRFLQACRRGLIEPGSYLLVESLDRISRMAPRRAQRLLDDIVDAGVTIVTLNDDQEYTSERLDNDPTALLIALMVSWRAHEESKTKARRLSAAWAEKRRKIAAGELKRLTSRGPSWLLPHGDGWLLDETKTAVVRRIFEMTLAGMGENMIAKRLNGEGVPVLGRGQQWHRSTVAKMLRNPSVIGTLIPGWLDYSSGKRARQFEAPISNAYPAIISESDWLAVRALKDGQVSSTRGRHAARGVAHLLAGLAKCPSCGSSMTRVMKGNLQRGGRPKLVCTRAKLGAGCAYVSIQIDLTDGAILRDWGGLMADVPAGTDNASLDNAHSDLAASIMGVEDLLTDLSDAFAKSPSSGGAARMAKVEAELRLMRGELEDLDERRRIADRGLIRSRLDDFGDLMRQHEETGEPLDITRVNGALKVVFSGVTVDHRRGYLRFQWRQGGETDVMYAWLDNTAKTGG